ncbi:anti-sigma factor [Cupriavidus sp. WKF15]|uniref:anti-sigma factor family protein n=1 Tax=Cupriavidus sp. WKF15 TaxID=3032282 RepID=UPI0023E13260|nr:anti-sigma factor [Cupriavidus sp. WKF15]WER48545.1 anti-sigma factor [Cupriavidus sp. WKF15]
MDCNEARWLLHASADGELGPADLARLEPHLASCSACAAEIARIRALRDAVREGATYHRADGELRARLMASLPAPPQQAARPSRGLGKWFTWGSPAGLGLALAMVVAVALGVGQLARVRYDEDAVAREIVGSHVRALLSGRPLDVASLDQHTVKPWFNGRLDYAPVVRDMAAQGFVLAGGRLDYVDGRPVAVVVYRRNRHPVDVFVFPEGAAGLPPKVSGSRQGYQLESWDADGMRFLAITDASADDLHALRRAWEAGAPAAPQR